MGLAKLTIDIDAICRNWKVLDQTSPASVETGACVKADGYGLGAARVARALMRAGCKTFYVAVAEEGAELRQALGPGPEIRVFSGHMPGDSDMIADMSLTPMLNSTEQLIRHLEGLKGHPFGIQLDSGMNRLGLEPGEWAALREIALAAKPVVVMSHLACADSANHPMNRDQLAAFRHMSKGSDAPRSLAATGGIFLGDEFYFDAVRPGIGIYGGLPFRDAQPVVHLSLPVIQARHVEAGETVGYANAWTAKRPSCIATLSAGYADGVCRGLAERGLSLYHMQTPCPVIGRISMDLITVDITDIAETPPSLDLLCESQTIDDLARIWGTIGYEVLTSLGQRYERRYVGNGWIGG